MTERIDKIYNFLKKHVDNQKNIEYCGCTLDYLCGALIDESKSDQEIDEIINEWEPTND